MWLLIILVIGGLLAMLAWLYHRATPKRKSPHLPPFPTYPKPYHFSLSTVPGREQSLLRTLTSLVNQEPPPARIWLSLPHYSKRFKRPYQPPYFLKGQTFRDVVRINECQDFGPSTKFIPSLPGVAPDTPVIVVDDDHTFDKSMASVFLRWESVLPNAALCTRGGVFTTLAPTFQSQLYQADEIDSPRKVDYITGWKGYLLKPRFFDMTDLQDYSKAPQSAFFEDDIWVSGHLARQKVARFVIPGVPVGERRNEADVVNTALSWKENRDRQNERKTALYFRNDWR